MVPAVPVGTFTALRERNAGTDMSYVGPRGPRHASYILLFFVVLKYHSFSTHSQNPKTKIATPNQEHITREIFLVSCIHTEVADENYIVDYQREGGYSIMI